MNWQKILKIEEGFSLIEALIGLSVFALIGLTAVALQRDIFSLNSFFSERLDIQYESRGALKMITREVRSLSPSSLGSYPIESATTNSITFYSDIDEDDLKEKIRYFLDGTTLKRGVIKPSGVPLVYDAGDEEVTDMIHNIVNGSTPIFDYYDTNYDGTTLALAEPINIILVRMLKVTAMVDKDVLQSPTGVTLTTQISMRNLKDN